MDSLEERILRAMKGLERKGIEPTRVEVFRFLRDNDVFRDDWSEVDLYKINDYVDIYRGDKNE